MKKVLLSFFTVALMVSVSFAQKQGKEKIDSLLGVLKNYETTKTESNSELADTNKVKLLTTLCEAYDRLNPREELKYGTEALELSQKINWKKGIAMSYSCIGSSYIDIADYPKALQFYFLALKSSEEIGDKGAIASNLHGIGIIYNYIKEYDKALKYFYRSLKLHNELGYKQKIANNYVAIAIAYSNLGNFSTAEECYNNALKINESLKNENGILVIIGNMGDLYGRQQNYLKAYECFAKGLALAKQHQSFDDIASNNLNISAVYSDLMKENNTQHLSTIFNGNKGKILQQAIVHVEEAIKIDLEIGNINRLSYSYALLSELQSLSGNDAAALKAFKNHSQLKDSVFNMEKDKKLTEIDMQYKFDKKEAATKAQQDKKDTRQRNIRNSIAIGFAATLIFSVVVYRQRNKIAKARKRSDELLLNILPQEVAEELKMKGEAEAKLIDNVTVLFTDFKGFTALSEKLSPKDLVRDLHECFTAFDKMMQKHGLEKIKTIGDAYMAASGLPTPNPAHAVNAVNAALEIRSFIEEQKAKKIALHQPYFEIRIGVHSGPVVAGIVGVKKFSYDIWGDTVNTASRMESSGEEGKVNISGTTYELVKDKFKFTYRGKISAKDKGEIDMYFVEG